MFVSYMEDNRSARKIVINYAKFAINYHGPLRIP